MAQGLIFVPHSHFCPYSFLSSKTPPPPIFFPYDKRGFWAVEITNKATGSLTYKLVLFIPGDKEYHISKKQKLG